MLLKCEVTSGLITLPLGAGLLFFLVESLTRAGPGWVEPGWMDGVSAHPPRKRASVSAFSLFLIALCLFWLQSRGV